MNVKSKILIFLLLILFKSGFSQTDFKISTDGYSFKSYTDKQVLVKIYLTAFSIGNQSDWEDDIRNFVLYSESSLQKFTLKEYIPILSESNLGTKPVAFSLTYIADKDAEMITLWLPDKYGGLKLKIYSSSYNQQLQVSKKKNTLGKVEDYLGLYFVIPYQAENTTSTNFSSSINHLGIGIGVLPIIKKFGKKKETILFAELKIDFNFALAYKISDFSKLYGITNSNYQVTEKNKDSANSKNFIYSVGIGVSHNFGFIKPMISINAALLDHKFNDVFVHDISNNTTFTPGLTAWGYQIEIGVNFSVSTIYLGYSFSHFSPNTNISLLNKSLIYNSIKFGLKGFGI